MKMRSIILTDEQHAELMKLLLEHLNSNLDAYTTPETAMMSEELYREIKDIKCCKNCRWGNMDDLMCEDTGVPIPCDPGFEEGPDTFPLFCWKRK
jgi:hypothetical protein